jgi:hypothetical protein
MDTQAFAIFYPGLAADLRQIEVDAMPGWVQTPPGQVSPKAAFAIALFTAVAVWLVIGLPRWDWAAWVWIPATVRGLLVLRGVGRTARCARTQFIHWGADRR